MTGLTLAWFISSVQTFQTFGSSCRLALTCFSIIFQFCDFFRTWDQALSVLCRSCPLPSSMDLDFAAVEVFNQNVKGASSGGRPCKGVIKRLKTKTKKTKTTKTKTESTTKDVGEGDAQETHG